MLESLKRFVKDEGGQDLVEYALLLSVLSLSAMLTLPVLGEAIDNTYNKAARTIISAIS